MEYQIRRDEESPYFLISLSGSFDLQDLEKCYVEVINHQQWMPGLDIIWDAQQCTFDHLTREDLNMIGSMTVKYKEKRGKGKAAWVVSRDIDFAVSRMFGMFSEDKVVFDFRVFRDVEEAKKFVT